MAVYFFDSSAVAKRYVRETGSGWIDGMFDPGGRNRIHIASVTGVEVIAAISRRGHNLRPPNNFESLIAEFRDDYANVFRIIHADEAVVYRAMDLAQKHRLRGYDALQLAAAIEVDAAYAAASDSMTLVSADDELNSAGAAEGLHVENPNRHPNPGG